jgi:hypothetical protein
LEGLTVVTNELGIHYNALLDDLSALDALTNVGNNLFISDNDALTQITGLNALTYVGKDLSLSNNSSLVRIVGFNALTTIEEDLHIENDDMLTDITGFSGLTTINDDLKILYNDLLPNLGGLQNVIEVGGFFHIRENASLTSIDEMVSLETIGSTFYIQNNDALPEITGFNALTSVGNNFKIKYNGDLTSISQGFQNLDAITADLEIKSNTQLTNCEAFAVCNYLSTPPGAVIITNNATGCDTEAEIQTACNSLAIDDNILENEVTIIPNPGDTEIMVYLANGNVPDAIIIYNQLGQKVIAVKKTIKVDVSELQAGVYYVVIINKNQEDKIKLIVN